MSRSLYTILIMLLGMIQGISQVNSFQEINLPESNEYAPSISFDGKTLVFESDRSGHWKLYETRKLAGDKWSKPRYIKEINDQIKENLFVGGSFMSYDGKYLLFTTDAVGGEGDMDIWMSERKGNQYSAPQTLPGLINTKFFEGFPSVSPDGNTLYFMRNAKPGEKESSDRYYVLYSKKTKEGVWGEPRLMEGQINYYPVECPKILPDGKTMIFAAKRPDSKGGFDLYRIKQKEDNGWSEPENLVDINTENDENTFTTDAQANKYYFAQTVNRLDDIFSLLLPQDEELIATIRLTGSVFDAKTRELIPASVNLSNKNSGLLINSLKADQGSFTTYLEKGINLIFEAHSPGYFSNSIELNLESPELNISDSTTLRMDLAGLLEQIVLEEKDEAKMKNYISLQEKAKEMELKKYTNLLFIEEVKTNGMKGKNQRDRDKLRDEIEKIKGENLKLAEESDLLHQQAKDGIIELLLKVIPDYRVHDVLNISEKAQLQEHNAKAAWKRAKDMRERVKTLASTKKQEELSQTARATEEEALNSILLAFEYYLHYLNFNRDDLYREIYLAPLEKEVSFVLKNINFDFDKHDLREDAFPELNKVLELLYNNPDIRIEISAHTDDKGSMEYNEALSQRRANSVVDYLISKNIDKNRLESRGYAFRKPIVPNDSELNRFINRRVEFKIID